MSNNQHQPSYVELAVLSEMFETEVKVRGIKFPNEEQREGAFFDFCQQYIEDQDTDPHINCFEDVTCEKEVSEIDWDAVYG